MIFRGAREDLLAIFVVAVIGWCNYSSEEPVDQVRIVQNITWMASIVIALHDTAVAATFVLVAM